MGLRVDTPIDPVAQRVSDRINTIARTIAGISTHEAFWAAMRNNDPVAVNAMSRAQRHFHAILREEQPKP